MRRFPIDKYKVDSFTTKWVNNLGFRSIEPGMQVNKPKLPPGLVVGHPGVPYLYTLTRRTHRQVLVYPFKTHHVHLLPRHVRDSSLLVCRVYTTVIASLGGYGEVVMRRLPRNLVRMCQQFQKTTFLLA